MLPRTPASCRRSREGGYALWALLAASGCAHQVAWQATVLRQRLPPGVTPAYFEGFLRRNRPALVAVLDRQLTARATRYPPGTESPRSSGDRYADAYAQPPDLWAASQRTAANLAAMRLAASKRPDEMSAQDRAALAAYSGWGGLSIQAVASQFPTSFPVPEERGLIHEYYTPTKVWCSRWSPPRASAGSSRPPAAPTSMRSAGSSSSGRSCRLGCSRLSGPQPRAL